MRIEVKIVLELDEKVVSATGTKDVNIILNTLSTLLENTTDDWWTYGPAVTSKIITVERKEPRE